MGSPRNPDRHRVRNLQKSSTINCAHKKAHAFQQGFLIFLSSAKQLYAWNELPQPQVLLTFGFSNLKPAPSSVST